MIDISQEYLKSVVSYDPLGGEFTWLARPLSHFQSLRAANAWNSRYSGKRAGNTNPKGYRRVVLKGKARPAHSLAYLYVYGYVPAIIDHANNNPSDNSICNLRPASRSQNAANSLVIKSSSGVKGVSWHKQRGRWQVRVRGKFVGLFDELDQASEAYIEAAKVEFQEFAKAGSNLKGLAS